MDIQTLFGLEGKTALVTGGATGIGRMAAEALVRAGARVVAAVEVRRPENLEQLASLHIWTDESVRADRLDFRPRHRLTAVVVSAAELREPVRVQRTPDYRGCASWVQLPVRPDWADPVHDETALERIADRVRGSVG